MMMMMRGRLGEEEGKRLTVKPRRRPVVARLAKVEALLRACVPVVHVCCVWLLGGCDVQNLEMPALLEGRTFATVCCATALRNNARTQHSARRVSTWLCMA